MTGVAGAVIAAIIVGTLYLGREVFVPIALAILLSFVLSAAISVHDARKDQVAARRDGDKRHARAGGGRAA
jgi:predicted PurR-regulated permease PerM